MDKSGEKEVVVTKIAIKKEQINEDIKEYAETAMNELLGWYGYGASSREESKTVKMSHSHSGSISSGPDSPKFIDGCGWCGKPVEENTGLSSASAIFCSELCFSQSRRANFKKNKTCDWCKHVRHTVSYVDFQDGASQLQFCSDKCLNQYKMHIFCRETRAHLEMHPHLHGDESAASLITPDLWMKNCKSPESRTSSPPTSPKLVTESQPQQTSPLPLITVAHPSKLMSPTAEINDTKRQKNKFQKKQKKRSLTNAINAINYNKTVSNEIPQDLRVRHSPVEFRENPSRNRVQNVLPGLPNVFPSNQHVIQTPYFDTRLPQPVQSSPLESILPPVTVMVPYPILLPIPLPIPIPIPLSSLLAMDDKRKVDEEDRDSNSSRNIDNGKEETNKESSRIDEKDVEEKEIVVQVEEKSNSSIVKPLRKRKRVTEQKSRIPLKSKKSVSV